MEKNEIIKALDNLGYRLDYDQWEVEGKKYMRFTYNNSYDTPDNRIVIFKSYNIVDIVAKVGNKCRKLGIDIIKKDLKHLLK